METFKINLNKEDELISTITIVIQDNMAELHQEVYKFSPSIYKALFGAFEDLKEKLKKFYAIDTIYIGTDKFDTRVGKYWKKLGFGEAKEMTVNGINLVYSEMEI